ncbi:2-hydroxyacid dehydrogenase [uncultured Cohaesibacter sp.]|uniref:2-hydroxyacid dehydrogenase n=1 Tax=uncultured Cohaesibacter sp. TaxID=1002546 RepID=UPI002930A34C|nr:2-hydroxyacid dehydrogenase [uncultured Cohaesibacter sp.]
MKPAILSIAPLVPDCQKQLEATYDVHRYDLSEDKDGLVASIGEQIKAVVTNGGRGIARDLIERLPNLGVVTSSGVGYDPIDVTACNERSIKVTNTPDVLTDDVADLTIALLLATRRNLIVGDAYVRNGKWGEKGPFTLTSSIKGKRIGIAGLGRIGRAIASRLEPMKPELGYWGRNPQSGIDYHYESDLLALAEWSDILIASMPGGAATQGVVSEKVLEAIGPKGSFINIARGSVVDEKALIATLGDGRLGSAGLDVFLNEPNPDPAFRALGNVVLHPHNASGTMETRGAMSQLVLDNLAAHFAGKPLITPVN